MKNICDREEQCCGCTACNSICPRNAIQMKENEEGFLYPIIDESNCVNCGLCKKVCPINKDSRQEQYSQKYYAVKHVNVDVVENSSSGGIFTALSDAVLKQGGVIYGVKLDEEYRVIHSRAEEQEKRDEFRGSKYVQSDMGTVMQHMEEDIKAGKYVMFTGSPCQVAGVRSFLEEKRISFEKVLLCDFICHGASSPKVWESYVNYFKGKYSTGLQKYIFRGKREGWHQWYPIIQADNCDFSQEYRKKKSYLLLYQTCFLNRNSCYECKYTSYERVSDITFADFWNIHTVNAEMDDNKGTSQVLINSKTGEKWFEKCKEHIIYFECSKQDVWQPHLEYANAMPKQRTVFWKEYKRKDFEEILKKYGQGDLLTKCKNFFTPILKKIGLYILIGKLYKILFVDKGKANDK